MKILLRIAPCFFAIIIDSLGFGLVYPVMAALFTAPDSPVLNPSTSYAMRNFYLGLGYLLYPLFMFFGASFLADLSDAWGRKKVLLICMLGIALSFLMMAAGVVLSSLWLLFAGRALSGLMAGSQPIAQASIVDLSDEQTKARNMGLISLNYGVGLSFGPFMGGVLADPRVVSWFGYWTPFVIAAILSLIAFVWVWLGFRESGSIDRSHRLSWMRPVHIFIEAFEHRSVRLLSMVYFCMQIGWSIYFQYLIVHMRTAYHYGRLEMGLLQGMFGLGLVLGLLVLIPILSKRMSSKSLALLMYLLTAVGIFLSAVDSWQGLQWVLAVYVSTVNATAYAAILTVFSDSVSAKQQGWVMGVSSAVMAFAWVLSGFSSNLLSLFGTEGLMLLGGCMLLFAAGTLNFARRVS